MKLIVNGSNSKGNQYVLFADNGDKLIIDAGISYDEFKQSVGHNIQQIKGLICTHIHGDHAKYINQYLDAGIKCYGNQQVCDLLKSKVNFSVLNLKEQKELGAFSLIPFDVMHDESVDCFGFLIKHEEMGTCCFMTDLYFTPYQFDEVNNWIIEANYCEEILDQKESEGITYISDRVRRSHFSIQNCIKFLTKHDLRKATNILLIHLSDSNSDADRFVSMVKKHTHSNVRWAKKGMVIPFEISPF